MSSASYGAVLLGSVLLFLFWGGPMWAPGAAESHLGRFAVSYGAILPAAALVLLVTRAYSTPRLITAVGTLWGIKLVITAVLFFAFGPRGGMFGTPMRTAQQHVSATAAPALSNDASHLGMAADPPVNAGRGYEAAHGPFDAGAFAGRVVVSGSPQPAVVVVLINPAPGRAMAEEKDALVVFDSRAGGLASGPFLATTDAELKLDNRDGVLRIVDVTLPAGDARRTPMPPRGQAQLELVEVGLHRLRVAADKLSTTSVIVVDHPYWARSDEMGRFQMDRVPLGEVRVLAVGAGGGSATATVEVTKAGSAEVVLEW